MDPKAKENNEIYCENIAKNSNDTRKNYFR